MDSPLQTNLCKGSSKFQEYEGTVHYYHIITFRQIQYVISSSGNPLLLNRSYEKCAAINTSINREVCAGPGFLFSLAEV